MKNLCIIFFIFLFNFAAAATEGHDMEKLAENPKDVRDCFKKNNPFIYCTFWSKDRGWLFLDKNLNEPYQLYIFDNGPDYPEDGLYRIKKNNKIGYADEVTGRIVIEPIYDCAFPFENGKAEVGFGCTVKRHSGGEHSWWEGGDWHIINKKGQIIP